MFARSFSGPAPGSYSLPADEKTRFRSAGKFSFGGGIRFGQEGPSKQAPGPGAYNPKDPSLGMDAKVGFGTSVRDKASLASAANPGPGAYSPTINGAYQTSPKPGFGTSTRGEMHSLPRGQPGPGTYETQYLKCVGKDSAKYSATSRRRLHDLSSYVTPGPGTYNAHATSFGAPGATSCKHVDDNYSKRDQERQSQMKSLQESSKES